MSVGLTLSSMSRWQRPSLGQTSESGCLKARVGDARRRNVPGPTRPRSNAPSASVFTRFTDTCFSSEKYRRNSTNDCWEGAVLWSVIRPDTRVCALRIRFGLIRSIVSQKWGSGGPIWTTWACAPPVRASVRTATVKWFIRHHFIATIATRATSALVRGQ